MRKMKKLNKNKYNLFRSSTFSPLYLRISIFCHFIDPLHKHHVVNDKHFKSKHSQSEYYFESK